MATTHEIKLGTRHTRKQQQPRRRCTFVAWLLCSLLGFVATAAQAVHLPAPTVEKAFSPTLVAVGGTSRMTITLTNNNSAAITAVQFTDSYPNGMANTPVGTVVADNTCGGTVTADPGGLSAALSNGTIPAQGSCEVVVNVNGTAAGAGLVLTNHTGPVFSANAFGGVEATADLSVSTVPLMQAPTVTMTALPASITVGGVGSMFVVLTNPNIFDITDAQFTINYPTPLHIVNAPGGAIIDEDTCAVVALAVGGGSSLTITGATIPGGSSCAFILSVTGTTAGDSDLDTGPLLSSNATPGVHAAATLSVVSGSLLPAPRLAATFSPTNIKIGGTSQLAFTFVNEDPNSAVTGLQQANLYNNVITNAPNALVSNTCGGLVILHAHDGNANDFQLLDGTIPPGGSCSVIVNVVGVQVGNFNNTPVNERNGNAETGSTASADVVVTAGSLLGAPTATKAFAPTTVAVGAPSQMTITLNNANSFAITGAQFTDNYPDGMVNASSNPVDTNTCGGTVTADPNGHSAALINGTIPAVPLGSCKVVINVVGAQAGSWVNQTGTIPAANALTGASVFGVLTVSGGALLAAPGVTKAFVPQTIVVGDAAKMTITLRNTDPVAAITGVQFSDPYPGGMANASSGVVDSNTCGGTVTAAQNGLSMALANGTIPANDTCQVVINIVGTAQGNSINHTGSVNSTNANPGADAAATLTVGAVADLTLSKTHVGNFSRGQTGATYTLTANNVGSTPTSGSVTVTDTLPSSLTATAMSGLGWNCVVATTSCTRSDGLAVNASYPAITLTVNVAVGAPANVTNTAGVSGGGENNAANDTASDPTTIGLAAPMVSKAFAPSSVTVGGTSQMSIALINPSNFTAITGVQFVDAYPAGMVNAPGNAVVSNTCGGMVTAPSNGASATLTNGTIQPNQECIIRIKVIGTVPGPLVNLTGTVASANANPGAGASATLNVTSGSLLSPLTATKVFSPANIVVGGTSQMTITLSNANANDVVGAQFVDDYPQGMIEDGYGVLSNTCGGFVDEFPDSVALINGTVPAQGSCSIVVQMTGTSGMFVNQTGTIASGNALTGNSASATLTVVPGALLAAPAVTKSFAPSSVTVGGASQMTITLTNPDASNAISGAQIWDSYPGPQHMANAPSNVVASNSCGGTVTAILNDGQFILTNGTIPANSNCSVVINVVGTSAGTVDNHIGSVLSGNANPSVDAAGTLTVTGAGTTAQTITFTSTAPAGAIVGDPDYLAAALATSGQPVVLTIDAASQTVCSINADMVHFIGMGTCTIDANQGGNAIYAPAPQVQQSFVLAAPSGVAPQTIMFTSAAPINAHVVGPAYLATAQATSGQPVVLTIDAASTTVCTISADTVNFIGIGTCTIDANQGGNANFAPAPQAQQSFAVATAGGATAQTITFTSAAPINAHVVGPTYLATAQATSGQPVVLTIDSTSNTVCTISADTVYFIGAGTCTIDANQGGDVNFAPASQVQQSFAVATAGGAAAQTITFTSSAPINAKVGDPAYLAAADATSGQPVVLTIDSASVMVCTISADTVQLIGIGTCTIDADQGGNATYAPAPQVQQSFAVGTAGGVTPQTIAFTSTAPANAMVNGPTYLAIAQATPSGLPVVLTIDAVSNTVCTINNGTVMFIDVGTCTIDANQGGNSTFAPAPQVQQSFAVASGGGGGVPIAIGDEIEVTSGGSATTLVGDPNLPSSVLDNDANVSTAELVSGPAHASAFTLHADGTFAYTNNGGTSDSFTYRARNAQLVDSNVATVTITIGVGLNNHAPLAVGDAIEVASGGLATALVGDPKVLASVLDNDTDPDANDSLTASKLSDPTHGTLTFDSAGTFSYHNDSADAATSDGFVYQVCDNHGACDMGIVTITIGTGLNNHLPIVVDDAIQTTPNGLATMLIGDLNNPGSVLDNDSDPDAGDTLTAVKASGLLNASGDLTFHSDGTFSYHNTDPTATTDSFLYDACDQHGACKAGIVTITITMDPPDLPPIAMNDAILVGPNGTTKDLVGDPNVTDSLLDNDSDVGDTLKAFLISAPANGDATVNPDGTFTYTNTDPSLGTDSFEYEACDSFGACTAATVSVTIDPSAPTVSCVLPRQLNMVGDTINVDLSLLFTPPVGRSLSYSVINPPPPSSIIGSLLTGILDSSGIYISTLKATTVPGGVSSTEDVQFQVLPAGDILLRTGFDPPSQPCQ